MQERQQQLLKSLIIIAFVNISVFHFLVAHPFPQALIDGPTTGVPRQSYPYKHVVLTTFVVKDLPRGCGTSTVKKYLEKHEVDEKWKKTSWAKKRAVVH